MANVFGTIQLAESDYVFNATLGQRTVYEHLQSWLDAYNADMMKMESIFVERTTSDHKIRYYLPGGGYMQETGENSKPGATKPAGSWDVAFPLRNYMDQKAINDVARSYMTVQQFNNYIEDTRLKDMNSRRRAILYPLFNNVAKTFTDEQWGNLTIQPLANGDSTLYPPITGSMDNATRTSYFESNYAASAISDTNNPYATLADSLEDDFGIAATGDNIIHFINKAQRAKTVALSDFEPIERTMVREGSDTSVTTNAPANMPGSVIGYVGTSGWVSVWNWIPANYILSIHLDAPRPLIRRVDPPQTGLTPGLQMVFEDYDFPFNQWYWRNRFGFGVGNRLNGKVMELGTGGTYTIPTAYDF